MHQCMLRAYATGRREVAIAPYDQQEQQVDFGICLRRRWRDLTMLVLLASLLIIHMRLSFFDLFPIFPFVSR
jgi:hypothetical protein